MKYFIKIKVSIIFFLTFFILNLNTVYANYDNKALLKRDTDIQADKGRLLAKGPSDSSYAFGNFVQIYEYCELWSNVNTNIDLLKQKIQSLSVPDYNNFLHGLKRFKGAYSCKKYKEQSTFDSIVKRYLSNLQAQVDSKEKKSGSDGYVTPSKLKEGSDIQVCFLQIANETIKGHLNANKLVQNKESIPASLSDFAAKYLWSIYPPAPLSV